jgi:FAD/FMN-containing dehydrogenase
VALMIICEADGDPDEAARERDLLLDALSDGATSVQAPARREDVAALWRWREGVPIAVDGAHGGKTLRGHRGALEHLAGALEDTQQIASHHDVAACSWGHAGDGNLHSTFMFDRSDAAAVRRSERAAHDLFALAARLGDWCRSAFGG